MKPLELRDHLLELARNHRWTWDHRTRELLAELPGADPEIHPAVVVGELRDAQVARLADDDSFTRRVEAAATSLASVLADAPLERRIAYFSPEFGVADVVPQYSGGLGILAGDHLKAASDLGLGLVGVGLFYREGFFRQGVDGAGQTERYESRPAETIGHVDTGVTVTVPLGPDEVAARVVRLDVGSVPLYLLDTDLDQNPRAARNITDRLYSGDREHRIRQELVLGVGGMRALAALGIQPEVFHLNEGHAGFLLLEAFEPHLRDAGTLAEAVAAVRPRCVFTTHTPVPAGIDTFDDRLVERYLAPWADRNGVPLAQLRMLAELPEDRPAKRSGRRPFNMAAFCLRSSERANGVSALHGEVSRALFGSVPGGDRIGHVTNGVHARTWTAPYLQDTFDEVLGRGWAQGDPEAWARAGTLDDDTVLELRAEGRRVLCTDVARRTGVELDPEALTVGFARRFATYKRADLLLRLPDRLEALLTADDRPVQFVFAGKAHPADTEGKALLSAIVAYTRSDAANGRFVFVPDYSIAVARALYAGCDVWLNNPIKPREASGTSGEKSALNGGLNCSIADGWWAEMADELNGWTIPEHAEVDPTTAYSASTADARRDLAEAGSLHDLLAGEIVPRFHDDPAGWAEMIRHVWTDLGPRVTAARMVAEYRDRLYDPAAAAPPARGR